MEPLVEYLGFDRLIATEFESKDGIYTGMVKTNMAISEQKSRALLGLTEEGFEPENSFAFGDSTHDSPLLRAVGNGFVLGSNPAMHSLAQSEGWSVHADGRGILTALDEKID